ncbi:TPA: helix-turn-helix domain-containing protein [Serratia fonticola]|uniref:helix-turn-helix domain-containing protein n=1 Tax=Serratia fonticola TaxID=47917 RepID=UPI00217C417A|nr:helix-turn-helix domain-containing protein [Serratia fonticola]CAI2008160.1 putative DNA-binding transcriptional regulator [Serratia fonticola]
MSVSVESLNIYSERPKLKKPEHSFTTLATTLSQQGQRVACQLDAVLKLITEDEKVNCYVLQTGYYALVRSHDNLTLTNLSAPMIVGLPEVFQPMVGGMFYLRAETAGIVTRVEGDAVLRLISENNMWESLGQVLSYFVGVLYHREHALFGQSVYHIVCYFLREMMDAPVELRMLNNVACYILQRTQISRSSVMRIISQLRAGGYITVQNGRLININNLPEFY